jgi:hypothetical protein
MALNDEFRIDYLRSYADQIALKIGEGIPVKSYIMWAFTDNFECKDEVPAARLLVLTYTFIRRARGLYGSIWSNMDRL